MIFILNYQFNITAMKKVLILEDTGKMFNEIKECFGNLVEIIGSYQISEAMDKFNIENPDFLIIDLYVPPSGLNKEEIDNSCSGQISGWLWIKNYVVIQKPEMKSKIIIYSDYIESVLRKKVNIRELEGYILMPKRTFSIQDVVDKTLELLEIKMKKENEQNKYL